MKFSKKIEQHICWYYFEGDLLGQSSGAEVLQDAEHHLETTDILTCAIDISKVNYMNSSGLTILIRLLTMFRNKGGEVVLIKPSEAVSKLLLITKLNAIFTVLENHEQVLKLFPKENP